MAHINEYDIQLLCSQQSALVYSQNRDFPSSAFMAQFKKYLNLPRCQEFTWIFPQAYFPFFCVFHHFLWLFSFTILKICSFPFYIFFHVTLWKFPFPSLILYVFFFIPVFYILYFTISETFTSENNSPRI